ncbi:ATP-binding protein [Streptomyces massasporeus]|uniref:ATP-binding protein n=1 Tax=Streptomyces massasporeus TaxID=67324 RepID=UPI0036800A19
MLSPGQAAAEAFYRVIDAAYEHRSVIVASNLHPSGFDMIIPKALATVAGDRLLHYARIVLTEGTSLRLTQQPPAKTSSHCTEPVEGRKVIPGRGMKCPPAGTPNVHPDGRGRVRGHADLLMGPGGAGGAVLLPSLIAVVVRRGIDVRWMAQPPIQVAAAGDGEWSIAVEGADKEVVTAFSGKTYATCSPGCRLPIAPGRAGSVRDALVLVSARGRKPVP